MVIRLEFNQLCAKTTRSSERIRSILCEDTLRVKRITFGS